MIMNPKLTAPKKKEEATEKGKENKEKHVEVDKSPEEIIEEKNRVDPFRVKVRKTVDFIKLKYL